ncbi:MAG: end-binding protein Ku [Blastocatellia bacterium]|jgi:DNA end-binding protein Ku|nr:end-binding protein Ku [Blastocatellia bacterium]
MPARKKKKTTSADTEQKGVRPFWSGTLTFGLVSVPVELYPGNRTNRAPLRMLGPENEPLARRYYSEKTGRDLDSNDMVRGYEIDKDKYVIITDEELERLAPEQSRDIDLRRFVDLESIPPIYFDRSYFLVPAEGSEKAYRLLVDTMDKSQLAGIATFVMRGKEYLVTIFAENGILRAETMRFPGELRSPREVGLPAKASVPAATVKKFERIIKKHAARTLPLKELKDEHTEQLLKLIQKKRAQHKDVVKVEERERDEGKVVDIMKALKKSLARKRKAA